MCFIKSPRIFRRLRIARQVDGKPRIFRRLGLPGVAVCTHAHPEGPGVHVCADATMLIVRMGKDRGVTTRFEKPEQTTRLEPEI